MRPEGSLAPFRWLACSLLLFLAALPATAQNLIPNSTFDDDISGWNVFGESLSPSWSSLDANGSLSSGSLRVVNTAAADNGDFPSAAHCFAVEPGERYRASGRFLYPGGQAHSGQGAVFIFFMNGLGCSGELLAQVSDSSALPAGNWVVIDTGSPVAPPGAVSALIYFGFRKVGLDGSATFHLDDALFGAGDPAPPEGPWLSVPDLPGFRFKVRITAPGAAPAPGTQVADCVPETVCVAGALPDRTETFLRVIGPRPNGYLWPQVIRFTVSRVEVWVEQLSSEQINYYLLPALPANTDELSGLVDRTGFLP
jgi:hypothetical protein